MRSVLNILVVLLVVMVGGLGVVSGAEVYTTGTSGTGTIHSLASEAGDYYCRYTTSGGFTVNGEPLEDVWAIIISEIGGEFVINGYGYSALGGVAFRFTIYGDDSNPYVSASLIIPIINDDHPELFAIESGVLRFFDGIETGLDGDDTVSYTHLRAHET